VVAKEEEEPASVGEAGRAAASGATVPVVRWAAGARDQLTGVSVCVCVTA